MVKGGNTRLVYLTPIRLRVWDTDSNICYTPLCYICRAWCMYEIVVIRGGWRNRRKYICLDCAIKVYPKRYLLQLMNNHLDRLSKNTKHKASLLKQYIHAKRMVERA